MLYTRFSSSFFLLSLLFSTTPQPSLARRRPGRKISSSRARHERQQKRLTQSNSASTLASKIRLNKSEESLKERWTDLLWLEEKQQRHDHFRSVRFENEEEARYYYAAELLADQLLGLDDNRTKPYSLPKEALSKISLAADEISLLWKSVAYGSTALLVAFPLTVLISSILSSYPVQSLLTQVFTSFIPFTAQTVTTWLTALESSFQSTLLQSKTFFRAFRHVKPLPLLTKIIRKCVILEAWRHIWTRVYRFTHYMWKGTLKNVAVLYVRLCPAWIRRGVKNIFQSTVQAQVQGALGSALGGVTFESLVWKSSSIMDSDSGLESFDPDSAGLGDIDSSAIDPSSMEEIIADSMSTDAAQGFQSTVQDALDTIISEESLSSVESAAHSMIESAIESNDGGLIDSIVEDALSDAISDGLDSSLDSAVDSVMESSCIDSAMSDIMETVVEDALTESVDSALDSAMDSFVEDALP